MARRKTLPESVRAKLDLAERLGALRSELFGDRGGPEMARRLNIPVRTWYNYEGGVTVPAEVMLKIIELTSVEPIWLLHGKGPKFRLVRNERAEGDSKPSRTVGALLRTALQMLENSDSGRARAERAGFNPRASADGEFEFSLTSHATPRMTPYDPAGQGHEPKLNEEDVRPTATPQDWIEAQRDNRCVQVSGDAMAPIVAAGASVAYSDRDESFFDLDGKIVVVWIEDRPIVRWFQNCGRYALLRAENPSTEPQQMLIDLENASEIPRFRRVLWINTPH
jgi:hypothetical protein